MKQKNNNYALSSEPSTSKTLTIQSLFLYLVFPLSQIICILIMSQEFSALYKIPVPAFYTLVAILLFFLVFIVYLMQKFYIERQTQKDYQDLQKIRQYQNKHVEHILSQRTCLKLLKSSFALQITEISSLLQNEKKEEALQLLQTLTNEINATREYPFCPNHIVNAILSDTEQRCHKLKIHFHAELQIGDCSSVSQLHLCSIFSNLLNNALNACQQVTATPYIRLTAKQSGDYLHIKVKNASGLPSAPQEGHGYGQKILTDIANQYSGDFRTHYENNTYEAYIIIQMP